MTDPKLGRFCISEIVVVAIVVFLSRCKLESGRKGKNIRLRWKGIKRKRQGERKQGDNNTANWVGFKRKMKWQLTHLLIG